MKKLHNTVDRRILKEQIQQHAEPRLTVSFYKYHQIADTQAFRDQLFLEWSELRVLGRTYIASEGINAQISVPKSLFDDFKKQLFQIPWLDQVRLNTAVQSDDRAFFKLIVKLRNKIVADGIEDPAFDPSNTGVHLEAPDLNAMSPILYHLCILPL